MRKKLFPILMGVILLITAAVMAVIILRANGILEKRYTNRDFHIPDYISDTDMDGDGIDDQTDMLQSVKAYLDTKPKYRSEYYAGGYPDDEYGVCTDVVGFGMLGAGYDLKQLVSDDVQARPDMYNIEQRDSNIDFRRVTNLKVYFDAYAITLTTDVHDIDQWQGGDIVVFDGHIGVVSDRRNSRGVTFVLHNGSAVQTSYEQDILESRDDIIGHYRISQ